MPKPSKRELSTNTDALRQRRAELAASRPMSKTLLVEPALEDLRAAAPRAAGPRRRCAAASPGAPRATGAQAAISRSKPFCVFSRPAATTTLRVERRRAAAERGSAFGIRATRVGAAGERRA